MRGKALLFRLPLFLICLLTADGAYAQEREEPGKPIGKVSIVGNLILMELDEGVLGREKLFDLDRHTLRFTPAHDGYRVENLPLEWDADLGRKITEPEVALHNFSFPFSRKHWDAFSVGVTGSIRFGEPYHPSGSRLAPGPAPRDPGGVSIGRFDALGEAAASLVNTVPAICVFFKPRMSGDRYVKELADRVVVSWDVSEPNGNIQDFTWTKTVNRFQTVLHKDGAIEMSYDQLAAKDAIIGIYPLVSAEAEKPVSTLSATKHARSAAYLDIQKLKLSVAGGVLLKATIETAGPVLPRGDPGVRGIAYRVYFYARAPGTESAGASAHADAVWTIRGWAPRDRADGGASRYYAFGEGVSRGVETNDNTISVQGILPSTLRGAKQVYVSADASAAGSEEPVALISAGAVVLGGLHHPEVHLSSLKPQDGSFPVLYEAFHYYDLPNPRDMSCTVIKSLGDKFDFLAYYSDFRVDNQEAGTPSSGPLGSVGGLRDRREPARPRALLHAGPVPMGICATRVCRLESDAGAAARGRARRHGSRHHVLPAAARRDFFRRQNATLHVRNVTNRSRNGPSLGRVRFGKTERRDDSARTGSLGERVRGFGGFSLPPAYRSVHYGRRRLARQF